MRKIILSETNVMRINLTGGLLALAVVARSFAAPHDTNIHSKRNACSTSDKADPGEFQPPLYSEAARPQIHFSPSSGFMNDPNGLVKSGDTWHMYYQYNPNDTVAGFQHWGHATSKDLYTWKNHPPAIAPENDEQGIFSGSAVLDVNNTSGLFDDATKPSKRFVAIYTLNTPTSQTQNIAYSNDGQNYTKYDGNPVLDLNTTQFRDPKVFWDVEKDHWVMTVAHPQDFEVGFYSSNNLLQWKELSRFGPAGLLGFQYECPDLVKIPVEGGELDGKMMDVLIVSVNPGAPLGGSSVEYFIGTWDGERFVPFDDRVQIADFGKDFYAAQTWYNAPHGQAIGIGWASNWQYTNEVPTSPWRSVMSTPRQMKIQWTQLNPMKWGYKLAMLPYYPTDLESSSSNGLSTTSKNQSAILKGNGAFEVLAKFSLPAQKSQAAFPNVQMRIFTQEKDQYLTIGFTFGDPISLYVDRRFAGRKWADENPYFTDRMSQHISPVYKVSNDTSSDATVELLLIIDRTITEVFAQNGTSSATVLHYWDNKALPHMVELGIASDAIQIDDLQMRAIEKTMPNCS